MFTQYFGNYLYESKVLTQVQFKFCLQQLNNRRAKLGVLAIAAGYMTPSQVDEIHTAQLKADKKFGELAIERQYLTEAQLEELLKKQSSPFSVFSQILVDEGLIDYAQLSHHIERYREHCGMSAESFEQFKNDDVKPLIDKLLAGTIKDNKRFLFVESYIEVFMNYITRFISGSSIFSKLEEAFEIKGQWIASQHISGSYSMTAFCSGSEEAMLYFASAFAGKQFKAFDAYAKDILGEFLNCCNGVFIANMVENELDLDLDPQTVSDNVNLSASGSLLRLTFTIEQHNYNLYMSF
jgi:CheY-specific phosphatase CheX